MNLDTLNATLSRRIDAFDRDMQRHRLITAARQDEIERRFLAKLPAGHPWRRAMDLERGVESLDDLALKWDIAALVDLEAVTGHKLTDLVAELGGGSPSVTLVRAVWWAGSDRLERRTRGQHFDQAELQRRPFISSDFGFQATVDLHGYKPVVGAVLAAFGAYLAEIGGRG